MSFTTNPSPAHLELRLWVQGVEMRADKLSPWCHTTRGDWKAHRVRATLDLAAALDRIEPNLGLRLVRALFESAKMDYEDLKRGSARLQFVEPRHPPHAPRSDELASGATAP